MIFYLICKGDTISTNYIQDELTKNKSFFDSLDLNDKQREAVVTDADALQIIAGAGTGKTTTLIAKVKYLIEEKGIKPSEILCLSFSRKSVNDLRKKLTELNISVSNYNSLNSVRVSTFHSFGNSFLNDYPHADLNEIFKEFIYSKIMGDFSYYEKLKIEYGNNYFYNYYNPPEDDSIIEKRKHYNNKKYNITALNGLRVRSNEDFKIANFLILNGIEFIYEPKIPERFKLNKHIQFDFYLPKYDIYIENLCFDDNHTPLIQSKKGQKEYIEQIKFKLNLFNNPFEKDSKEYLLKYRNIFKDLKFSDNPIFINDNGSRLIVINSYGYDDSYLKDLKEKLEPEVEFNPISDESKIDLLEDNKFVKYIPKFKNSFNNFVKILKEKGLNAENLVYEPERKRKNNFYAEEINGYILPLAKEYFDFYNKYLEEHKLIDFPDMILKSIPLIEDLKYKYVLVDEYQDISNTRFELLDKIKKVSGAKLVVVGDDWQSIFGFAGCEVGLFSNFENAKKVYLEETFRASNQLITAAGDFIDDEKLIHKELYSKKFLEKPIELHLYGGLNESSKNSKEDALVYDIIEDLSKDENNDELMILSRYNKHLRSLKKKLNDAHIDKFGLDISYNTFHTAKGLESQNVIILDVNNSYGYKYGIPYLSSDNEILPLNDILDLKQYDEERRLFYVALTRTKNKVYLCADKGNISNFIGDLDENCIQEKEFTNYNKNNPLFSYQSVINEFWEKKRTFRKSKFKCPKCGEYINLYIIRGSKYIACSNFKECGWFVDEEINNNDVLDNIRLCKMCKKGILFSNNYEGRMFCSAKECKQSEYYLDLLKEKGQRELTDFKDMVSLPKSYKKNRRKRKREIQKKLSEY